MKVLITGGGGFIGVSLAEKLAKEHTVTLLDKTFKNNTYDFSTLHDNKNVSTVEADILDVKEMKQALEGAQIIIHTAAIVGVQSVLHNTIATLETNYIGTSNVLKIAAGLPGVKRVVCFSTSEVFGAGAYGVTENSNINLPSVQDVRWSYSISKIASEQLAMGYFREKSLPVVVVRPFNIYGPKRSGDYVVLRFILQALENQELLVYGDGTQIRAWCHIDDFCRGLLATLTNDKAVGQAFNIGSPRNTLTIYELAKMIIALCRSKSKVAFKPLDFMDIDIRVPNVTKMKEVLGVTPEINLEQGLAGTIDWVKANHTRIKKQFNPKIILK
jgi:UDP-glucose 4-epimerase